MIALCVFMFSGCGGSADSDSEDNKDTDAPNDYPDTYNTQNLLNGTWVVMGEEMPEITIASGDNNINMQLVTASMTFSNTKIDGSTGTSFITNHETWQAFLDVEPESYLGVQSINLDNQVMTMVQTGSDKWKCDIYDEYRTLMNIELLSEKRIQVYERRITVINNHAVQYEVTFNMRKQN